MRLIGNSILRSGIDDWQIKMNILKLDQTHLPLQNSFCDRVTMLYLEAVTIQCEAGEPRTITQL